MQVAYEVVRYKVIATNQANQKIEPEFWRVCQLIVGVRDKGYKEKKDSISLKSLKL